MIEYSRENCEDYIGFLEGVQRDISEAGKTMGRLVQHAPEDQRHLATNISAFLRDYAAQMIGNMILLEKCRITTLEE